MRNIQKAVLTLLLINGATVAGQTNMRMFGVLDAGNSSMMRQDNMAK